MGRKRRVLAVLGRVSVVASGALLLASVTVSAAGEDEAGLTGADGEISSAQAASGPSFGSDAQVARAIDVAEEQTARPPADPAITEVTITVTPLHADVPDAEVPADALLEDDESPLVYHEVTVSNETAEPVEQVVVVFDDDVVLVEPADPQPLAENPDQATTGEDETSAPVVSGGSGQVEIPLIPGTESVIFVVAAPERALSGDDGPLVAEIGGFERPADGASEPEVDQQGDQPEGDEAGTPSTDGDVDLAEADPTYTIGDLVWLDADDDGEIGADEEPIGIVRLELFADADADGVADDADADGSITSNDALAVTTTGGDGRYTFTGLDSGEYVVGIPPSEWAPGRSLAGLMSSTPVPIGSLRNVDDIGDVCSCGYVMSGGVAVGTATGDASGALDQREDLSVDFGFWRPALDLGITVEPAEGTPAEPSPGSVVTFVIAVTNLGNVAVADISVVDTLPSSITLDDATWVPEADGTITTTIAAGGALAPGDTVRVTLRGRLSASASGSLVNVAAIVDARPVDADGFALRLPPGELVELTPPSSTGEATVVVAQGTPAPTLPATGTTSGLLASAGLALLLLGIGIVTLSSRVLIPSMAPCSDEHAIRR